ncbi:translation initiation factor IF-2 subunit beta [Candidatus Micrarchaeota archaeon]|nr:translation initiation factor IF-2 subunit beta [Candidatus Micrarchaeota archaeon]
MDYDSLLDKAHKELPDESTGGERFEPPKLEAFAEGNKTIIKNFSQALQKIRRKPEEVLKFLTREFAVPATVEGDRLILHRKINSELLNKKFNEYVKNYVICSQCGKPDTHIEATGHRSRVLVCEACGARTSVK